MFTYIVTGTTVQHNKLTDNPSLLRYNSKSTSFADLICQSVSDIETQYRVSSQYFLFY